MSDPIKHECGIALVRLLKPLGYYQEKYGSPLYGFNKLFLLMEKQHNRGQDGAGIGAVKIGIAPGHRFMFRDRNVSSNALPEIFQGQLKEYQKMVRKGIIHPEFPDTVKENFDYGAELLVGHLRYGTSGNYGISTCHPFYRKSTWPARNLMLVGNFNITNTAELNAKLIERGIHPVFSTDTQAILEEISFHLDIEHGEIYRELRDKGVSGEKILQMMNERLNPERVVSKAAHEWDGGYVIAGIIGNGDSFVLRDPHGIRPCHYIQNDEVIAFASERVPLMTVFDAKESDVHELEPGTTFVIKSDGTVRQNRFTPKTEKTSCMFERIYFSRGNDPEIYRERKAMGEALCSSILKSVGGDFKNTIFSYIPNTAEIAYYGLMSGMRKIRRSQVREAIAQKLASGEKLLDADFESLILDNWPRGEKIAHKDIKMRTFISREKDRMQLASHVYDISYGVVEPKDNLVCLDDSIVRGTTLKQQILRILSKTNPKKIVIASTAPQIRYPDCYGIDMSELGKFIAFQAAVRLCKETGKKDLIKDVYYLCAEQEHKDPSEMQNYVKLIYEPFTVEEISRKVAEFVYPQNIDWCGSVDIVYQTIEDLHKAVPSCTGDWYFTGNYPTPGGYRVLNRAYMNYYESKEGRSY